MRRSAIALGLALVALAAFAATAFGAFPYSRPGSDLGDPKDLFLDPGQTPGDLSGNEQWMYSATPESPAPPDLLGIELGGVRGGHVVDPDPAVATAWRTTTGRPDVQIAVLDSGIKWNDDGPMANLRFKTWLNPRELPTPLHDRATSLLGGGCGGFANADDANGDGVFNLGDFACDSRVSDAPANNVNTDLFEPQDVLIAFSDGTDADSNGFADDIVGWDFLDDDNDPYDDVQYGHGTGEAQDSTAEADNGQGGAGVCPNCLAMHMRVGDSFVADVNRFAQAALYATDNGALVIQEALGALNNSRLSRQAVDYAYRHGTVVLASAADEAAQHNNWPSSLPHVILVNSVTKYDPTFTPLPLSYLQFNGCTNFNAKVTLAIPSVSCSSDAVGRGAGMAGLIYSAAINASERGKLDPAPGCTRTYDGPDPGSAGDPCLVTPNEVRQLMATGFVGGVGQADDVDFMPAIEPSCGLAPIPGCTGTLLQTALTAVTRPVISPLPVTRSYPARGGHDQFYGYGRVNLARGVGALVRPPLGDPGVKSLLPPQVEISSPEWYDQLDPAKASFEVRGQVSARPNSGQCTYRVLVAPGHYPNNDQVPAGDFQQVGGGNCDDPIDGVLANVSVADLRARFPIGTSFDGPQPSPTPLIDNGRPFQAPNGFTVKVQASTTQAGTALLGQDHRAMWLHRDSDMLNGFPRKLTAHSDLVGDGASSPAFADLDGDDRNELVIAGSDGFVHAMRPDGSELPGWPVRGDPPALHTGGPAFDSEVSADVGGPILASVAVGDANRDGIPEVYAADLEGKITGWEPNGQRVFAEQADPDFSGKPLSPFANVRDGNTNRTQHGFIASPVLADIDGDDGGRLEIVAAGMDRHLYAWNANGSPVPGYPVLVVDPAKVLSIDPVTHRVEFKPDAASEMQGAIVDTPAIADLDADPNTIGDDELPEIVLGTNEEYAASTGSEGPINVTPGNALLASILGQLDLLSFGNSRLYALDARGDRDGDPSPGDAIAPGWPARIGLGNTELLPIVGEGITGSPVIGPADCPNGGPGPKVGVIPGAGFGYILNRGGESCYGRLGGNDVPLQSDFGLSPLKYDTPMLAAVGHPAFGDVSGSGQPKFLAPAAGAIRALDLAVNEYQGGQDFLMSWETGSGQPTLGFPGLANDLQFLTGPSVADIDGAAGEEVIAASASFDVNAYNSLGLPVGGWPKLSSDWTVANPLIGSWGSVDDAPGARKVVVNLTRSGYVNAYRTTAPACSPSSWPRFHHDNANSGHYDRDAVAPGAPDLALTGAEALEVEAPGDDLRCGSAASYELATSNQPLDERNFASAAQLAAVPVPAPAGEAQPFPLPAGAQRYLAIRALDEQGNVGRVATVDRGSGASQVPAAGGGAASQAPAGGALKLAAKRVRKRGRRSCFLVTVTERAGGPVGGARISLGTVAKTTPASGRAKLCRRLGRRPARIRASAPGYQPATLTVRAPRRRR